MIGSTRVGRTLPIALLAAATVVLAFFFLQPQNDPVLHNKTVNGLGKLADTEDKLLRDLMAARSGLLHNYDAINDALIEISETHRVLTDSRSAEVGSEVAYRELLGRLGERIDWHARTVQRLMSDVAIFRKSLLYLPECAGELQAELVDAGVTVAMDRLLLSTRMYVHGSSEKWSAEIERSLHDLESNWGILGRKGASRLARIRAHADHVVEYRDRVAEAMEALAERPLSKGADVILAVYLEEHAADLANAKSYRSILATFVFVLMLGLCVAIVAMSVTARSLAEANEQGTRVNNSLASLVSDSHLQSSSEFYGCTARSLANAFSTAIAFISIPREDDERVVETLALYMNGEIVNSVCYDLGGTPCDDVLSEGQCVAESGVQQAYPDDAMLVDLGIESYFGRALTASDGTPMGVLAVMDTQPLRIESWMRSLLDAFADRIAGELERRLAHQRLVEEKTRAIVTLRSLGDAVITVDREGRVTSLNPVAEQLLGAEESEAVNRPVAEVFCVLGTDQESVIENPVSKALKNRKTERLNSGEFLLQRGGQAIAVEATASPIIDGASNVIGGICAIQDVTVERELQGQLSLQANYDALTGVYNRRAFEQKLELAVGAERDPERPCTLLYLDLDRFKSVNDSCGHKAGDALLRGVCELIEANIRDEDVLGRLGGDEFGLLIKSSSEVGAQKLATRLVRAVEDYRFVWQSRVFRVGASVGLVSLDPDIQMATDFLAIADTACMLAKESGRNRVHVHRPDDTEVVERRSEMRWVSQLEHALEENNLLLYQQPIVPASSGQGALSSSGRHLEILIRMRGPEGDVLLPGAFMGAAERFGLMPKIDRWVVRNAFTRLADVSRECELHRVEQIGINLSGQTLADSRAGEDILGMLEEYQITPNRVCFEVTETAVIANLANAIEMIEMLRMRGCKIALDDFGSGLSSYAYLKNLCPDYLKIDREFVRDLVSDKVSRAIVGAVVNVSEDLGIKSVAEGVEDAQTAAALRELGVDYLQGYYFGMPASIDASQVSGPKVVDGVMSASL